MLKNTIKTQRKIFNVLHYVIKINAIIHAVIDYCKTRFLE